MTQPTMDGRRRRYVPLDVYLAFGDFGSKLIEEWGIEGIGCWMLFLAACKRETPPGTLVFGSDEEAWSKLGSKARGFTLDEFFAFTGRHRKTRRTRHGRISNAVCTGWDDWNTLRGHAQKPRSEALFTEQKPQQNGAITAPEVEGEVEGEVLLLRHVDKDVKTVYEHWRTCRGKSDSRYDQISPARRKKITTRLAEFSVDELKRALDNVAADDWADRPKHDDVTTLFKSREAVDRWLEMTPTATAKEPDIDFEKYNRYTA